MSGGPSRTHQGYGFVERFRPGEHRRVETALDGMAEAGASYLRTHLTWADFCPEGGEAWYDWLIPTLGRRIDLLPCIQYTPPSLSRTGPSSGAPHRVRDHTSFVDLVLSRYGGHFTHVELWNEPSNLLDWDWREDHDLSLFCEMVGDATHRARQRGWKVVVGGPSPFDRYWLNLMGERGFLAHVAAVGCHRVPGTWDSELATWHGWEATIAQMRDVLARHNCQAEIWITETGYSTWKYDEAAQLDRFLEAAEAPADRFYWNGWQDIPKDAPVQEGRDFAPRLYHLGVTDVRGRPKLLRRPLRAGGIPAVRESLLLKRPALARGVRAKVVIGGAGFLGANLADALLPDGEDVIVFDNLSRDGVQSNLAWLKANHADRVHAVVADLRNDTAVGEVLADADAVFHLAAQVAVTTSIDDPAEDFAVNAQGTLTVLETLRRIGRATPLVFVSTTKVYGSLDDLELAELDERYVPVNERIRRCGLDEARPLSFYTPYGCSKGVADQYVLDYARTFGLPAAVLRMSCIYGPRQFGTEDQGWVAHFLIRALAGEAITLYGNGKQVRDVLHVDDAVAAYRSVLAQVERLKGRAFNLGGGPANAVSLRLVLDEIRRLVGRKPVVDQKEWRTGDQLYFVADTSRLREATGWQPRIQWRAGLAGLAAWLAARPHTDIPRMPESRMSA
jgi:CDP-paratose 2-epimerase